MMVISTVCSLRDASLLLANNSGGEEQLQGLPSAVTMIVLSLWVNMKILPVAKCIYYNRDYKNWEITIGWICEIDPGQNSF